VADEIQLNDPQTLYRRWEESQWSPFEVDLRADARQWPQLEERQRELVETTAQAIDELEARLRDMERRAAEAERGRAEAERAAARLGLPLTVRHTGLSGLERFLSAPAH
jgi:ribonucleotide reductase beta subunit family protein with ferritin-like domain